MSIKDQLLEMGFDPIQIDTAIANSSSLEDCVAYIEQHQDDFQRNTDAKIDISESVNNNDVGESIDDVNESVAHDDTSLTDNTSLTDTTSLPGDSSISTNSIDLTTNERPLTAEEKQSKLEILKEKARLRKIEQAKKDAEERRKNEAILKKQTKERREIVEEQELKQAQRDAAKRRQEALDDKRAKQRVRDLIEADKRARAEEKARKEGLTLPIETPKPSTSKPQSQRSETTDSRIRFRVQNKPIEPFVKTYPIITTLGEVAKDIASTVGETSTNIQFMTTFPTQTYTKEEFDSSLKQLGLINTNLAIKLT